MSKPLQVLASLSQQENIRASKMSLDDERRKQQERERTAQRASQVLKEEEEWIAMKVDYENQKMQRRSIREQQVHIYIYAYTRTHIGTYNHTCVHTCHDDACIHIHTHTYTNVYMHANLKSYVYIYVLKNSVFLRTNNTKTLPAQLPM